MEGYIIDDHGKDRVGDEELTPEKTERGRFRFEHTVDLEDDWHANVQLSAISDRGFLREYYGANSTRGVDQDTSARFSGRRATRR